MRRYVQRQLLQLAEAVWNGIRYAGSNGLKEGQKEDLESVLRECYAGIDALDRTLLDSLSSIRHKEYQELLDYVKELLEMLNVKTNPSVVKVNVTDSLDSVKISDLMDALNDNMSVLLKELKCESEVKLEIVFLPYKASMWDCFDSIWKAAAEDEGCRVTVVPIPYYDKSPDGKLCNYYYEGDGLPAYVKTVHYQEYSIQQHKPDIVYIHNPYDGSNYVTSVAPEYYSGELRKYTDRLVYVPYFIASGYSDAKSAWPYIAPIAIINTDYIIYQSPVQLEMLKELGLYQNNALVLGSPKLDYYAGMKDPGMPDKSWEKCRKFKKTVLMTATLDMLLAQSNDTEPYRWISRMQSFLDVILSFPDLALIFRPHPLMKQTIRSMRPYLIDEYEKLESRIAGCSCCIIDHEQDSRYAVYCADALISDGGSMTMQFMAAEKPVLNIYGYGAGSFRYQAFDLSGAYFAAQMIYPQRDDYLKLSYSDRIKTLGEGIHRFCGMILKNQDPKKEERLATMRRSVANCDGTAGRKIHRRITSEILEK